MPLGGARAVLLGSAGPALGAEVPLATMPVFAASQQRLTTLSGWPAGRMPKEIAAQGSHVHGYLRRSIDYGPNNDGTWIDLVSGWRKTPAEAPDTIQLRLDDDSLLDLKIDVTHALPGSYKVLDRTGAGSPDFTDWDTAITGLVAGDTLVVRAPAGTWTDSGGHSIPNYVYRSTGTPNSSVDDVTIMAHPDDVAEGRVPVVMRDADNLARFVYSPSTAWEVYQTLSDGSVIYRSVDLIPVPQSYCGFYRTPMSRLQPGDPDHTWVAMFSVRHPSQGSRLGVLQDVTYPQTSNWTDGSQPYRGPSISWEAEASSGRIYCRLTPPAKRTIMNPTSTAPWPPWDWSAWHAPSEDPRNVPIWIATGPTGSFTTRNRLVGIEGRSGWQFENIAFFFGTCAVYAQNAAGAGPQFRGCYFVGGTSGDFSAGGSDASGGLPSSVSYTSLGTLTSDFTFDHCQAFGGYPPWGSWLDGKGAYGPGGMSVRREFIGASDASMVARHCYFDGYYQFLWLTTGPAWAGPSKVYLQHCLLRTFGSDGALISNGLGDYLISRSRCDLCIPSGISGGGGQLATISNSLMVNAAAWVTTYGGGPQQTIYSDLTHSYARDVPMFVPGREISHGSNTGCLEHVAQSLFIGAHSSIGSNLFGASTEGAGSSMTPMYIGWDDTADNSLCFNNIGVLVSSPYGWPAGRSAFVAGYRTDGSPLYDHNHVWKVSGSYPAPGSGGVTDALAAGVRSATGHADIAALRAATSYETNGTEGDASFAGGAPSYASTDPTAVGGAFDPSRYLLAAGSMCRTGGNTGLADHGIKDVDIDAVVTLTGRAWRGPLAPDVPIIEQRLGILGPPPPSLA